MATQDPKTDPEIEEKEEKVELSSEDQRRAILQKEKEEATKNGKPWVAVLDTQVNPDNIKNGFFELDWNEHFVEQLAQNGYSGATPEAIVDQWVTDLCKGIARQQQESGSFVANEDIIKMSDLQREENEKDKDDE